MEIEFTVTFGHESKQVNLSQPTGAGSYYIMIDKFYHGQIVKTSVGFRAYTNTRSELTSDDLDVLVEMVEAKIS